MMVPSGAQVPRGAADCHMHVFEHAYPWASTATLFPDEHSLEQYRSVQRELGIERHVLVQPSSYGTDNRLLLRTLARLGPQARGVAVLRPGTEDAEIAELHRVGVRGLRFNLVQAGATTIDMIPRLAGRVAGLGWHIQVHAPAQDLLRGMDVWGALPCPVVFDHLARVPQPAGVASDLFQAVARLLADGRAWVKLSGFYLDSQTGAPDYTDSERTVAAFVAANPARVVWGSDWPHVTERQAPDDRLLFAVLRRAVPDEGTRARILVDNPAQLYGWPAP
ncbi:amidohydrolase family protein [Streptomyces flaveolus]|uniref:amidohydrolase family protein n=1 Tax=Streptomyces flaveolus TaxID=67297 RepID=UPI003822A7BA